MISPTPIDKTAMATTVAKLVRLVRCPKCLKLLPEMADVPMYQCGGCGVILKAKYHDSSNQNVSLISESDESSNERRNLAEIGESSNAGAIDISNDALRSATASSSDLSQNVESNNLRTVRRFSGSFGTKAKDGGKSLDSDAFYSIRSWVESDKDIIGPSRSLSRRSAFFEDPTKNQISSSSKFKNRELLNLVEELTDQLGRSYELKKSNKARTSKSYCRPVSGGAPFVICRKCYEVLYMPADFLISRNRSSKLKCGSCSEVMVLSFPALTCNEAGNPTEGPDSFSEEYGISFADTSSSTGTEVVLNVSKASSEMGIEEKASAGRLHQLMGYPSARVLLFENSKSLK